MPIQIGMYGDINIPPAVLWQKRGSQSCLVLFASFRIQQNLRKLEGGQ